MERSDFHKFYFDIINRKHAHLPYSICTLISLINEALQLFFLTLCLFFWKKDWKIGWKSKQMAIFISFFIWSFKNFNPWLVPDPSFIQAERSDSEFYKENVLTSASFSLQKSPGAAHRSRIRPFCSESPKSELLHNVNGYFPGRFWTRYNVQAIILAVLILLLPNFDSASFSTSKRPKFAWLWQARQGAP